MTEAWRKLHETGSHNSGKCDKRDTPQIDGNTWFRFVEPAGTKLPIGPNARSKKRETPCGTHFTAYLKGSHPTISDGVVSRLRCYVFGKWIDYLCTNIDVAACPNYQQEIFYIYKLKQINACHYGYCAE